MPKELVMVNEKLEFWTGGGFNPEYPEAFIFPGIAMARIVGKAILVKGLAVELAIIEHYGYDNEKVVDTLFKG